MNVAPRTQSRINLYNPRHRHDRLLLAEASRAIAPMTLPDEAPDHWRSLFDQLVADYQPATRGQLAMVEQLTIASIDKQRAIQARMALLGEQLRTAEYRFHEAAEAEVETLRALLPRDPPAALARLLRSAAGTRYLVGRGERLGTILQNQPSLHGQDRDEMTILLGAKAGRENLAASETAFVVWLYCLVGNDDAKKEEIEDLGDPDLQPQMFHDHEPKEWIPCPRHCRILLAERVEQELASLRPRAEWLRIHIEEPARAAAREQARVLAGTEAARAVLAAERHADQALHRAYQALERGRRSNDSRTGARFDPGHREDASPAAQPGVNFLLIPPDSRAGAMVLDYHAAHAAVLDEVGPD